MMKKIEWHTEYAKKLFYKYVIGMVGLLVLCVCLLVFTKAPKETFLVGCFISGYFVFSAYDVYSNNKNDRYYVVRGAVVSVSSEGKLKVLGRRETYRIIPVDEEGEYINRNGKYDIFLETSARKNKGYDLMIGRVYEFAFLESHAGQTEYSEQNLVCVSPVKNAKLADEQPST